ncbi:hypothetical protein EWM64_g1106 [Hericium alpestre]|uniref:DUF6534 domain-containing protein n=1 Tax=Hericium alpestre TaxID=135208 RepID=A0A4Z0A9D4_9AGAM|nr:hypothetical protein EWM64_g1106 [Hericium alpestre]
MAVAGLPNIDNTIGAAFIGWGVSSLIFGILCIQVYTYFERYTNDNSAYKSLVLWLWLLEALHQAFVGHCVYYYEVTNYGNLLVFIDRPVWTLSVQVVLGAFVGLIVKMCFGLRVWKFSKHNYLVTGTIVSFLSSEDADGAVTIRIRHGVHHQIVSILPPVQDAASTYCATDSKYASHKHLSSNIDTALQTIGTASLALGAATDIFTAASLSYFLHKMRTGYQKSDTLINRLILYSVNTGFLTSAVSIAVLALYNTMPDNFIFMGAYFVLSKLYANSCVATLNTRRFVRGKGTDREEEGTGPTFMMVGNPFRSGGRGNVSDMGRSNGKTGLNPIEVDVRHEISVTSDTGPTYSKEW